MEYQDFVVSIERDGPGMWRKRVIESPAGQANEPFVPPFPPEELARVLDCLGREVRGVVRDLRPKDRQPGDTSPIEVGMALYRSLFSARVGALYDESRGRVEGADRGLRVKLRFDPGTPGLAWVPNLPWELLCRPATEEFLGSDLRSPVVRYLEVPRPATPPAFEAPVRVLVALSNPKGSAPLNLEKEKAGLENALGAHPGEIEPVFLEKATLDGLRKALRTRPFHAFHFMGHGAWDERTGEGSLLFETASGNQDVVGGSLLADVLKSTGMPMLAVLNACETARVAGFEGASPFGGVASALVRKGMPAVVAMQFPITDDAAIVFAEAFYNRIVAGDPVDTAVGEGRVAIRTNLRGSMEWATPVLFMRTPDGCIFESRSAAEGPTLAAQAPGPVDTPSAAPTAGPSFSIGTIQGDMNFAMRDLTIHRKG